MVFGQTVLERVRNEFCPKRTPPIADAFMQIELMPCLNRIRLKKGRSKTSPKNIPTAKRMKKIGLMTKMFAIFPMVCLFLECLKSKIFSASVQTMVVEIID